MLSILIRCDDTPPTDPHYLMFLKPLMAIDLSRSFSNLWPGVFHIPLPTHKIHNQERGRKEEQAITGLFQKQEGRIADPFVHFVFLWAKRVLKRNFHKPLAMLTHFLAFTNPASLKVFLDRQLLVTVSPVITA